MSADNFKITNNIVGLYNKNVNAVKSTGVKSTSSKNKKNGVRMDTFEITNSDNAMKTNFTISPEINAEKNDIVREISQSHSDVNKFLEIKAQVRAGKYKLDSQSIADSLAPYFDYDLKA